MVAEAGALVRALPYAWETNALGENGGDATPPPVRTRILGRGALRHSAVATCVNACVKTVRLLVGDDI